MRRRLIVLRHAKSSWGREGLDDHERPLNERGRRDAPAVAARLVELGWAPARVLCSTATRARETYALMGPALEPAPELTFHPELYLAGPAEVEDALAALPDGLESVMLVGHNSGWERVVAWLTRQDVGLTTCNAALLSVEADTWAEAVALAHSWRLHQVLRPKEL